MDAAAIGDPDAFRPEAYRAPADTWVAGSREELLAAAEERIEVNPGDARSGSTFERVRIGDEWFFAKTLGYRTDWIMRVTHDRDLRTLRMYRAGIMTGAPAQIDHGVVGMAADGVDEDALLTILMRDLSSALIPEGDSTVSLATHLALIDGMAALSAHYWGWADDLGLASMAERVRFFAPDNIAPEAAVDDPPLPVAVAVQGWPRLAELSPQLATLVAAIHADPRPWTDALEATPSTFLQGDWKMGNLGVHDDGRTVLLDWAYPGSGPVLWDLAWYLALNAARLPISKEDTVVALRDALERRGIATADWFETQLDLCLLGMVACFGWEKAMGDAAELKWWESRARVGAARLSAAYPSW